MENNTYVFNPQYRLKNDKNRILIYYKSTLAPIDNCISDALGFLHPILALLLALFNGKKKTQIVLNEFIQITNIDRRLIKETIKKLLNNKNEIKIKFDGNSFIFPKNTLIFAEKHNESILYNPYDFIIPKEDLDFKSRRLNVPLDGMIYLNNICATQCIYCYVDKANSLKCQIPFERLEEIVKEAKRLGLRSLSAGGGEVFSYKNWQKLLQVLLENNLLESITTKYPLNHKQVMILKELGIQQINLSLDTVNSNQLCNLLNVGKNYHRLILNSLKELNKNNINICIQAQVTSINQENIKELFSFLLDYENVNSIKIRSTVYSIFPKGDENNFEWLRAKKEKLEGIREMVNQFNLKYKNKKVFYFHEYPTRNKYINENLDEKEKLFQNRPHCSGNFSAFYILPDGKVTICEHLFWHPQFVIGNIKNQSIEEIWNSKKAISLYNISKEKIRTESACHTCNQFENCHQKQGVCWNQIISAYGNDNWDLPDPRCPQAPPPKNVFWID